MGVELSRCCARSFPRTCKKKSSVQKDPSNLNNDSINHSESHRRQNNTQVHPRQNEAEAFAFEDKMNQMLEKHLIRMQEISNASVANSPTNKNIKIQPKNPIVRFKRTQSKLSKNHGTIKGSLKYNVKVATLLKKAKNRHDDYGDSVVARNQRTSDRQADAKLRLSRRVSKRSSQVDKMIGKDKTEKKKNDKVEKKQKETVVSTQDLGKIKKS